MREGPFDPARSVRFDLARGSVHHADARHVLFPVEVLDVLAKNGAGEAVARVAGTAVGKRAAAGLEGGARRATLETFTSTLGGEIAVAGGGLLAVERWGRAMVLVLSDSPLPDVMVGPFLAGALEGAAEQKTFCTLLERDAKNARVLVSNEATARRVHDWLEEKVAWGEALARLQSGGNA
jgi:hypothetical protein